MKPKHEIDGYAAGASGYRHKCRCDECKASNRRYQRKHRTNDESPTIHPVVIEEPIQKKEITTVIPQREVETETVAIVRDETIPYQIIDMLDSLDEQDHVIYTPDNNEGWGLQELSTALYNMADVICEIHGQELHVRAVVQQIEVPNTPITMLNSMTITGPQTNTNYPAQPRFIPKASTTVPAKPRNVSSATAPSVPGEPYRTPSNVTRNVNTSEPFSL